MEEQFHKLGKGLVRRQFHVNFELGQEFVLHKLVFQEFDLGHLIALHVRLLEVVLHKLAFQRK